MPRINVTLKDGASADDLEQAKKQAISSGGKIVNEFKLIKGFTAEFPEGSVHSLATNDKLDVENDGVVTTQ